MILHILDEEKFLKKAIQIFDDLFPGQNIYLVGTNNNNINLDFFPENNPSLICLPKNSKSYINTFKRYAVPNNLIFFHNLYKEYKLKLAPYIDNKVKVVWYVWGAEFYGLNPKIENLLPLTNKAYADSLGPLSFVRKRILAKVKQRYLWHQFQKIFVNKVDYMVTNIKEDMDLIDQEIENYTKKGWFTYFSFGHNLENQLTASNRGNVLIGNSSSETNNHFDAFEILKNKINDTAKIYIPLSYGDMEYKKTVISHANSVFGNQSMPLTEYMCIEDYNKVISSCSVLLMNHKRQQAFNTIMMAIAAGCKVFLREENTIFSCLKREGFIVYSIQNQLSSSDALDALTVSQQKHNVELCKRIYSYDAVTTRIKKEILDILSE
nr:TDP-N-acetylfucosamine:lipid II N-acetylfucosaminyltransferase [uncultured Allomuricauda sp.]